MIAKEKASLVLLPISIIFTQQNAAKADDAIPAAATTYFSYAAPYLRGGSKISNYTCYISNIGTKSIRVRNLQLRNLYAALSQSTTSCPKSSTFELRPGKACYIGASTGSSSVACLAEADDVADLRGAIEARQSNGAVLASFVMQAGGDITKKADEFEVIASPPMFGSPSQQTVSCTFLNAGQTLTSIKNVRFVSSTGQVILPKYTTCSDKNGKAVDGGRLAPSGSCFYGSDSIPVADLQCRGSVNNKAQTRAATVLTDAQFQAIFNQETMK